jgi:thiamine biosynthesis lipoprotein
MSEHDQADHVRHFSAMASRCEIRVVQGSGDGQVDVGGLIDAALAEVQRIEFKYSRYRADSIVSRINAAAGSGQAVEVDDETAGLLDFAAQLHALSDGLFDITSGVLRRAWHFQGQRLPSDAELNALLPLVGWQHVQWSRASRRIALTLPGMELDFGGFGKEYAADRAAAVLQQGGLSHGYVNLGGDLRVLGPRPDGSAWLLGIQHPRQADGTVAGLPLHGGALATSGDYERFMELDGRRYCHILDPRTGWPVSHWQSISVVAPVCAAAGALSTIAMLKQADALDFLRAQGADFLAIDANGAVIHAGQTH